MTDVVDTQTRSRMMANIATANTKPEMVVRRLLHASGFRYRLHAKDLPGKPDLVLPRHRVVVQVNGCFWHGHDCHLFKWPKTNRPFWKKKIEGNRDRDQRNRRSLNALGWDVMTVWECATRSRTPAQLAALNRRMTAWIVAESSRRRCKTFRS